MSDHSERIREAKSRLTIPALWARLDLPGAPKASCKSPFRKDRHASFSVSADGLLFNDFATSESGDAVDFLRLATGLSREAAFRKFLEMAGGSVQAPKPIAMRAAAPPPPRQKPSFPDFEAGSAADFAGLGRVRNYIAASCGLASERGLLRFANLRGIDSWIVTDGARVNAQARRMDGGTWEHLEGNPKAWTLRGSWASHPIGARESKDFPRVALVEGGGDLLAAFHFIVCEDRTRDVAPVAMLGASQRIPDDVLPLFTGKRIRLFPHLDDAGQAAAERWARQLEAVGAEVDAFSFAGLHQMNGEPVGDLNDLACICADDFERERATWAVMP